MDRNTIIGFLVIAGMLIGYSLYMRPSQEDVQEAKRVHDSIALAQQLEILKQQQTQVQKQENTTPDKAAEKNTGTLSVDQQIQQRKDLYGAFSEGAAGEKELIILENDLIKMQISNLGGRIYSVELKNYKTFDGRPLILFDGDSTIFGLSFFAQNRSISTNDLFFQSSTSKRQLDASKKTVSLSMKLSAGEGRFIEYNYSLSPGDYMVDFDLQFKGMNELFSENLNYIDLNWEILVPPQEMGRMNEQNYTSIFFKHFEDEVEKFNARSKKEIQEKDIPTKVRWMAYKQQFFSSVLICDESFSNVYVRSTKHEDDDIYLKTFTSKMGIPFQAQSDQTVGMRFYFGPNNYTALKKFDLDLESLVGLGGLMSRIINKYAIIPTFNFLSRFFDSYGIIILLLTIIIKIVLFPLTYKSYMSMAKMRVLKPEIDAINEKIPKEKAMERQQATMALYKKVGVSPLGGCLPMVFQMPILISMFRFFPVAIELRQQKWLWAHDLSTYDSILDLPFTIPMYGDHVSLFTLLMTASTILTMKISNQATASNSQMPGMKGMMYIMPVMFMFMLNNWSSALTYYYFLANVITFGQNQLVKQFVDEDELRKKLKSNQKKTAPKKKSGFQKRLEDMAKQRGVKPPRR